MNKSAEQEMDKILKEPSFFMDIPKAVKGRNYGYAFRCAEKAFIAGHQSRDEEVKKLVEALEHIANPIKYMRGNLEPGYTLDGGMAMQMSQSASYLKGIAEEALKPYQL